MLPTVTPSSLLPARLCAHGLPLDLSPEKFGFLHETHADEDVGTLHGRMDDDGYLYLREFWSRDKVQAVRDSVTGQLARLGFLKPGTPPDEARFDGREVGRAMGNPLSQHDPLLRDISPRPVASRHR